MAQEQPLDVQTSDELDAAIEAVTAIDNGQPPGKIDELSREAFDELSGGVVRAKHAEEAMLHPDDFTTLRFGDCPDLYLATKRVQAGSDFVVLAIASRFNQTTVMQAGYRLYGNGAEVTALTASASLSFRVLLERFGRGFESEGRRVLFVPVLSVAATEDTQQVIGTALDFDMSPDAHWGAHVAARQAGDQLELSWPFVVDLARYRSAAQAQGWQS